MSQPAKSMFVFGIYLVALGAIVLIAPNLLLSLFGVPATSEVWIRIVGTLVLYLAFYYIQAARKGLTDFMRWTIYTRSSLIVFLAAFALLGFAPPVLVLFGVIDLLGAIWTAMTLRAPASV